jgi:hypothetical protein
VVVTFPVLTPLAPGSPFTEQFAPVLSLHVRVADPPEGMVDGVTTNEVMTGTGTTVTVVLTVTAVLTELLHTSVKVVVTCSGPVLTL